MNNELYHYGVKGMRWGVRRYQDKSGRLTPAGKERYRTSSSSAKNPQDFVKSKANTPVSKMAGSEEAVALLATVAVYATMFGAAYASAKVSEKRSRNRKVNELEELNDGKTIKSFKDAPKLSKKMSPEDSAKVTNPEFPSMGTTMNCTFCTTAMALRERGYDVRASKSPEGWYSDDLFKKTFNSPEVKIKASTNKQVVNALSAHGDGAYGNLVVNWKLGGSHSIFWKNENGTTNFYDGQSGKAYKSTADINTLFGSTMLQYTRYNRLDNCEPTDYALALVESNKK